jgi:hypothetical protein
MGSKCVFTNQDPAETEVTRKNGMHRNNPNSDAYYGDKSYGVHVWCN